MTESQGRTPIVKQATLPNGTILEVEKFYNGVGQYGAYTLAFTKNHGTVALTPTAAKKAAALVAPI